MERIRVFAQQRAGCAEFLRPRIRPPFQRNQFGVPREVRFRKKRRFSSATTRDSAALAPDKCRPRSRQQARGGFLPCQLVHQSKPMHYFHASRERGCGARRAPLLSLWPIPTPMRQTSEGLPSIQQSAAKHSRDFGTARLDIFRSGIRCWIYRLTTADLTATPLDPFSSDVIRCGSRC